MLSKSEKNLISAVADAGLGEDIMIAAISGMNDEQMLILTEYIRNMLKNGKKVTNNNVLKKKWILVEAMPNVWDYAGYRGRIRITTRDKKVYVGTIFNIKDSDDDESALDDSFILDIDGNKKEIFAHEVWGIEPLD